MARFDLEHFRFTGEAGDLPVLEDDEAILKFAMLLAGECDGLGPSQAAARFGFSPQRYFQLRKAFLERGSPALVNLPRGPKTEYRRTQEAVCQALRHRLLDPEASSEVIAQKLRQSGFDISKRSVDRIFAEFGFQKKLYQCRPDRVVVPEVESYRTYRLVRVEASDPPSLERGVRQLLADKVSGNMVGLYLLVPEHLRLGTWDLLRSWTGQPADSVAPRLGLQMVHEAALCVSGIRQARSLSQRGFELANGLPFLASDTAIHHLLNEHTVEQAQELQVRLGVLRRARGHFQGHLLVIDPHRLHSHSRRQMLRHTSKPGQKPFKVAQTFFCLDPDTCQPVCFTSGSSALTVSQATPELLDMAARILNPDPLCPPLAVADTEHHTAALVDYVAGSTPFDLLVPQASTRAQTQRMQSLPPDSFIRRWAGFALAKLPYRLKRASTGPHHQLVQRSGERPEEFHYKSFLCTRDTPEVDELTVSYPKRWHVEEFFNAHQQLGWHRAGTLNRHIRYGQMSLALIAQAALHQLRQRLAAPWAGWDAPHFAQDLFRGADGDIRVYSDTIVVTFYKLPQAELFQKHYQDLPGRLRSEGIDPRIPWLYNFKLDFRFC